MSLEYVHVDVFSDIPYGGNSLAVFPDARGLRPEQMLCITRELRHFEAIFLEPTGHANTVRARVFDLFEELPFAGHPVIGAAAVLHHASANIEPQTWQIELPEKIVTITTEQGAQGAHGAHRYSGMLNQGTPEFFGTVTERDLFARAFNLKPSDLCEDLPLEVISTGLCYLIIPVKPGALERARILSDITDLLRVVHAQFAVLLDDEALEMRHWNNDGHIEDVATGSAAGTVGAYLLRHGLTRGGDPITLNQGRFTGRPSILRVQPEGTSRSVQTVKVGGDSALVGRGMLDVLP